MDNSIGDEVEEELSNLSNDFWAASLQKKYNHIPEALFSLCTFSVDTKSFRNARLKIRRFNIFWILQPASGTSSQIKKYREGEKEQTKTRLRFWILLWNNGQNGTTTTNVMGKNKKWTKWDKALLLNLLYSCVYSFCVCFQSFFLVFLGGFAGANNKDNSINAKFAFCVVSTFPKSRWF